MMTSELLIWKHEIPKRNILGSKVFWYFLGRLLRNYPQGIFYLMYSYIFLKRMSLAAALIGTQNLKDSPESGSGKIQNNKQLRQLLLCVSWDWGWSCREVMHCAGLGSMWEGDCRVMRMMEYHTQKNAPDLLPLFVFFFFFSLPLHAECQLNIRVFCLFSQHVVWKRVTRGSARWEKLWNQGQNWSELGGPGFSAATC